ARRTPRAYPANRARRTLRSRAVCTRGERGHDPFRFGFGEQPGVLVVADALGLVDEHDRDVVLDEIAPLEARVVQRVLVGEVQQRALVLRTGEDLEQL